MGKVFINGMGCVSAQQTMDIVFGEGFVLHDANPVLPIVAPAYKDYIAPAAIRRMSKGVKNGIVASATAMKDAGMEQPDAIIVGTGLGCLEDSNKFLKAIIDNQEAFLTPTSFIQSTHNTVGAQIALGICCKGYNVTYTHGTVSFESALMDALLKIAENEARCVLVGGIDELNDYTTSVYQLAGIIKKERDAPYSVLNSTTNGAVYSEGATFFVVAEEETDSTYAAVADVAIINRLSIDEVEQQAIDFLQANGLAPADIDALILGYNGDAAFDSYYTALATNSFAQTPQVYYKHLCGEYNTASAFGMWVGANIIKIQSIPQILKVNAVERSDYSNVLLYNQYQGIDQSFILLSRCRNTK